MCVSPAERTSSARRLWVLLALAVLLPVSSPALALEPGITSLTLQEIIAITVKNHPLLRAGEAQVVQKKGAVIQVQAPYNPQVSFQSSYSQSGSFVSSQAVAITPQGGGTNVIGGGLGMNPGGMTSSISLAQLLTDFGKIGASIRSSRETVAQFREQLDSTLQQVLLNVYQAYFQVLQDQELLRVQQESVENLKRHLEQSEQFFAVGTVPKINVTQAQVSLSNGLLSLEQARNTLQVAEAHLTTTMGTYELPPYQVKGELHFDDYPVTLEDALGRAIATRPDLKALMAQKRSLEDNLIAQLKGLNPTISANGSYLWKNNINSILPDAFNYSLILNVPIYNGELVKGEIMQAKGQVDEVSALIDNLKLSIIENVTQSYLNQDSAKRSYKVSLESLALAKETLSLADQRYAVGVGSYLEYTDAQLACVQAENSTIQNLANYNTAIASLKAAIGILE